MASKNVVGHQLATELIDRNLNHEQLGAKIGVSGMTVRRAINGEPLSRETKWLLARYLGEEPSTYWPPMPGKRQPGGSRRAYTRPKAAA